jgi:hypothetical protein
LPRPVAPRKQSQAALDAHNGAAVGNLSSDQRVGLAETRRRLPMKGALAWLIGIPIPIIIILYLIDVF